MAGVGGRRRHRADEGLEIGGEIGGAAPFDAAHYHPTFTRLTPCDCVADATIQPDPFAWISRRLADVPAVLTEARHADLIGALDPDALRQAMPAILATIQTTLAYRPTVSSAAG